MRAIINLWTYKNFCAAAIFRASGEVAKVEKEADQEVIGPGHRILPFLGGQGELLKEFQKKCDLTPFGLKKNQCGGCLRMDEKEGGSERRKTAWNTVAMAGNR